MANSIEPATDGIKAGVEVRKQRGLEIAALAKIEREPGKGIYHVPSQYSPRPVKYKVEFGGKASTCTCPDFETRGCKCKHIWAVQFVAMRERNGYGEEVITESLTITKTRKTYPQDWANYNRAQVNEKKHFHEILASLCRGIPLPEASGPRRGRPQFPLADGIFAAVSKVYSTRSGRRFISDMEEAKDSGHISQLPHYNTVFKFIEKPGIYPILLSMIETASLPLRSVESNFAVDSTGFAFCRFVRWYDIKYNRFTAEQQWVKAHICAGVKTNVVTAIEIHQQDSGDAPILPSLVASTAKNFKMMEVSADSAYSGRECHDAIAKVGAVPYIAFKSNATGGVGGLFEKMFHYFQFKREEFLAHYHHRSNAESTVMMIKTKFGDSLRSKASSAAKNEVLAKVLCHNICCLISAMYELGIQPVFGQAVA